MSAPTRPDRDAEERAGQLLDVLSRGGLVLTFVLLCDLVFAPFLVLMVGSGGNSGPPRVRGGAVVDRTWPQREQRIACAALPPLAVRVWVGTTIA